MQMSSFTFSLHAISYKYARLTSVFKLKFEPSTALCIFDLDSTCINTQQTTQLI